MRLDVPTEEQKARVRKRWKRMQRFGRFRFILAFGTILFLWTAACYVIMMRLMGRERLLHESFVVLPSLACCIVTSFTLAFVFYWTVERMARRYTPTGDAA